MKAPVGNHQDEGRGGGAAEGVLQIVKGRGDIQTPLAFDAKHFAAWA